MSGEAKAILSPEPMVSFRSASRIRSYLVRAKLYPLERCVGSRQYKKRRCEVCTNVTETDTFSSTVTGETFQINHELNCDDKCLIYLLKCKVCNNLTLKNFMAPFYGWGSTALRLQPLRGGSLLFTTICRRNNRCISPKVEQLQG